MFHINDTFKANVPYTTRPQLKAKQIVDGVLYYISRDGRRFVADQFDKMFGTGKTGEIVKNKFYKGANPCKLNELIKL